MRSTDKVETSAAPLFKQFQTPGQPLSQYTLNNSTLQYSIMGVITLRLCCQQCLAKKTIVFLFFSVLTGSSSMQQHNMVSQQFLGAHKYLQLVSSRNAVVLFTAFLDKAAGQLKQKACFYCHANFPNFKDITCKLSAFSQIQARLVHQQMHISVLYAEMERKYFLHETVKTRPVDCLESQCRRRFFFFGSLTSEVTLVPLYWREKVNICTHTRRNQMDN